jgi:hypothetical protein
MNIFGAFTFGSLIKTFLPGMIWLFAIGVLEADLAELAGSEPFLLTFVQSHMQESLVLGFPLAILLGLLSNIIAFMGINDRLVRDPVRRKCAALFTLHDQISARVRDRCWQHLAFDEAGRPEFDAHIAPEIVVLPALGHEALAYVREQYWYHLEFQMNLFLSLVVLFLGASINAWTRSGAAGAFILQMLKYLVVFVPIWVGLVAAARKNYSRHISTMLSLMAGILCQQLEGNRLTNRE